MWVVNVACCWGHLKKNHGFGTGGKKKDRLIARSTAEYHLPVFKPPWCVKK